MFKTHVVLLGVFVVLAAAVAPAQESALDAHLREHPAMLEDGSMSPFEARLLDALTPEQAEAFAAGEDPRSIVLESGETLASFIASLLSGGQGLVYVSLDACKVLRTVASVAGSMAAEEQRDFFVRGPATDLSAQGGSDMGCLVPTDAVAVAMHFRVRVQAVGVVGRLHAGRTGGPPLPNQAMEYLRLGPDGGHAGLSIVPLCEGTCASGDFYLQTQGAPANVRGDVIGFFRPIEAGDIPGGISGGDADTLDGLDSTDFAAAVHTHEGGDITSGTVGEPFIDDLITRDDEVVDIVKDNDGSGSGIDADLLDGRDSLDFALQVGNCLTVSASCPAAAPDALAARCWQTISAALAAINGTALPLATATNRYVIKVGPGTYSETVSMKQYVDIEGSGQKLTTISGTTTGVVGADDAELRQLTVEAVGPGPEVIAMFVGSTAPMIKHVTLRASGATTTGNFGLLSSGVGSAPMLKHVSALASAGAGAGPDTAVLAQNSASVTIRDSTLDGDDASASNTSGASASIVNTQLVGAATDGASGATFACLGAFDGTFTELDANCQ